jgi:hypothetical protein
MNKTINSLTTTPRPHLMKKNTYSKQKALMVWNLGRVAYN